MSVTIILFLILSKIVFNTGTNDIIGRMIAAKEYGYQFFLPLKNMDIWKITIFKSGMYHKFC